MLQGLARSGRWVAVLFAWSAAAGAATFEVTKTADTADGSCDADCSLREAVQAANAAPGADEILLAHPSYPLTLTGTPDEDAAAHGDLDLAGELLLRPASGRAVIDAATRHRVVEVLAGASVELRDVTLKRGFARGRGGALYNAGSLTLRRVWVVASRVIENPALLIEGGGIYNAGTLVIRGGRVHDNIALGGPTFLAGGRGGGIFNATGASLRVADASFEDNWVGLDDANGYGAGIYSRGTARIERSFFRGNDPGGGEGAAIANRHGGRLTVINTTISANGHDSSTGAIANGTRQEGPEAPGSVTLVNATIVDNNGGGLYNGGSAMLRNSLIGGNYVADGNDRNYYFGKNCMTADGATTTQTRSIIGADGGTCPAFRTFDNAFLFELVVEPLADLGGPTPAHALRPGPYGIDNGHDDVCPALDQRRVARPADGDHDTVPECDIGAVEMIQ